MARHQAQQRSRRRQRAPGIEQQRFFPVPRDRPKNHRPRQQGSPSPATRQQLGLGRDVELQVAQHFNVSCARQPQPRCVALGLRQHLREAGHRRVHQRRQPLALARAAFRQACIGQHHRHTQRARFKQQVGPDLGFHQHTGGGPMVAQEAAHSAGGVVRQPGLCIAFAQQRGACFAACRRAVGQQQPQPGPLRAQGLNQRCRSARFAQRHRVQPQAAGLDIHAAEAQPLGPPLPVGRFSLTRPPAPPQPRKHQRRGQPQQQRVGAACQPLAHAGCPCASQWGFNVPKRPPAHQASRCAARP